MKLSVYSLVTPDLTPEQLVELAKLAGIDGVEWLYYEVPQDAREEKPSFLRNNLCSISPLGGDEQLERFKKAADSHGLTVLGINPDKYLKSGNVESTERALAAAKKLGAKFIRLAVPLYDRQHNYNELLDKEMEYLRKAVSLCKQYGVKGLVETHHKTIAPSASAAYRLCERFDTDWIGVTYDPGNMVFEGFENYRMGMELLGPYLAHVHVKNGIWNHIGTANDGSAIWEGKWTPTKQGIVPWKQVIEDLQSVGYNGYLSLEDFSGVHDSQTLLTDFVAYMRRAMET